MKDWKESKLIVNKLPVFRAGEILDKEMLELMRDNPTDLIELYYNNFEDGILSGLEIVVKNNFINIQRGLIKYNGYIYKILKDISLVIPEEAGEFIIKLKFLEIKEVNKKIEYTIETIISEEKGIEENELFIADFNKQSGTYLRYPKEKFDDFGTNYNMVNIIKQISSCESKEGTLSVSIISRYGQEILKKKNIESLDYNFAFMCINSKVKRLTLLSYISVKNKAELKEYSNQEIYLELKKILDRLENDEVVEKTKIRRVPRMLVD